MIATTLLKDYKEARLESYIGKILSVRTKVEHPGLVECPHHDLKAVWPLKKERMT